MIEVSTLTADNISTLSCGQTTPSTSQYVVPRDLINKFDVEKNSNNQSVEDLLREKISSSVVESEAFYIVDLNKVIQKYSEWVEHLPRVKPYYAIKCNPNTAVIRLLASLNVNFDCASRAEIQQILGCGVSASRIIYANPCKMKSHIEYASSSGVDLMTFDNYHELVKIAESYPSSRLLLRIITDDSQSVCRFSTKFGCPLNNTKTLLAQAKELNLNVCGISFHVGSGCMSSQSFISAIRSAHRVFQEAEELGMKFTMLDLGGGWPGTNNERIDFRVIADSIRPVIDELFPEEIDVIAEPGRYFVAESHTLAMNVFGKRTMIDESNNEKSFLYYANDGVYQSFNCILFDHYTPTPLILNPTQSILSDSGEPIITPQEFRSTIFGPTCDSMDCVAKDIPLQELQVGDWLYFKNMGAYSVAAASPFNGFKANPTTFYIN